MAAKSSRSEQLSVCESEGALTWRGVRNAALVVAMAFILTKCNSEGGVFDILRLGSGFTAKTICSGVFVSHRTRDSLWYELGGSDKLLDLFFSKVTNTTTEKSVTSSFLGLGFFSAEARYRGMPLGCYVVHPSQPPPPDYSPPLAASGGGSKPLASDLNAAIQELLSYEFTDEAFRANQTRAVVVLHKGKVVGEGYQTRLLGIGPATRMLGWSMTKTVHAMVVGAAMGGVAIAGKPSEGDNEDEEDSRSANNDSGPLPTTSPLRLSLDSPVELADLETAHLEELLTVNGGKNITFRDLMGMSDLLGMREVYSMGGDVPRMLFLEPDAAKFAATIRNRVPLSPAKCDRRATAHYYPFGWYYSSGMSNVLAKEFRRQFPTTQAYYTFVLHDVLSKIGSSFVFETDAAGTFVASSFLYATALDFARVGMTILASRVGRGRFGGLVRGDSGEDGGLRLPDREFAKHLQTPHPHSGGIYSASASVWLNPSRVSLHAHYCALNHSPDRRARFRWMAQTLPRDCLSLEGYQGQFVLVCPSLELVVVRLGLTPGKVDHPTASDFEHSEDAENGYSKSRLIGGIIQRLGLTWKEPK